MTRIDNESLSQIKYLDIYMENIEFFRLQPSDILEIQFDDFTLNKKNQEYTAQKGRLLISKKALNVKSRFFCEDEEDEDEDGTTLKKRIAPENDICSISLVFLDGGKTFSFNVPYDPVEEVFHGNAIENSNCPSAEYTESGDMLLLFGEWSRSFRRVDNDYTKYVDGFGEFCGELKIQISHIETAFINGQKTVRLEVKIKNKEKPNAKYYNREARFTFSNVRNFAISTGKDLFDPTDIYLAPMKDGTFYVGVDCAIDFLCSEIKCKWYR